MDGTWGIVRRSITSTTYHLAVEYGPTTADYLPLLRRFDNRQTKRPASCQRLTVSQDEGRTALNHRDTENGNVP
jgi:hypothetical protein